MKINSNHVRIASFVLLLVTGILAAGDITKVFPFLPVNYATLTVIVIVALKEFLLSQLTPSTNQRTPDNTPPPPPPGAGSGGTPVSSLIIVGLIGLAASSMLTGCVTTTGASIGTTISTALADPNKDAKAVQVVITGIGNRVLAKNPSYAGDFVAVGDALTALASSNLSLLGASDIQALLGKTHLSAGDQAEISADFMTAQGFLLTDFDVTLPQFKPIYSLWIQAVANGFYQAAGHPAVPLPVVPIPAPVTPAAIAPSPTVAAVPASSP